MSSGLPPASTPRIFITVRARTAIKIVDYEYPSFSQGKAPWERGYRFPLGIVERAGAREHHRHARKARRGGERKT